MAQLAELVSRLALFDSDVCRGLGMALCALGIVGTLWAQLAMGASWRIGVDATARTELVANGPFRWVRNPIFTFMLAATLGLALLVPNPIAWVALLLLFAAVEIQVRRVEEPYLQGIHGRAYQVYCAQTGRFLPHLGHGPRVTPSAETEPKAVVDLMMRIAGVMAGQEMPESVRPMVEEGARREDRVVLRLRPYQTFHSQPKHVHQASDVDEKLLHGLGDTMPW